MSVLLQNDFTAADSPTVVPAPAVGPTPTQSGTGAYGVQSNRLYASAATDVRLIYPIAQPDISLSVKVIALGGDAGIMFRVVDASNFMFLQVTNNPAMALYKCVANTFTQLANYGTGSMAAGDTVGIETYGEQIRILRNGISNGTVFSRQFITGGGVGFRNASGDVTGKFDDLLVKNIADVMVSAGALAPLNPANATLPSPLSAGVYKGRDTAAADLGSAA